MPRSFESSFFFRFHPFSGFSCLTRRFSFFSFQFFSLSLCVWIIDAFTSTIKANVFALRVIYYDNRDGDDSKSKLGLQRKITSAGEMNAIAVECVIFWFVRETKFDFSYSLFFIRNFICCIKVLITAYYFRKLLHLISIFCAPNFIWQQLISVWLSFW